MSIAVQHYIFYLDIASVTVFLLKKKLKLLNIDVESQQNQNIFKKRGNVLVFLEVWQQRLALQYINFGALYSSAIAHSTSFTIA